jgi:hypothetical protein
MDAFDGTPRPPTEPAPLAEPALYDPPALEAAEAFSIGRALGNGWFALKRAPVPMFIAGLIMSVLDSGSGGGNGGGGGGGDRDRPRDYGGYDDPYSDLVRSIGRPVRLAVNDTFGDVFGDAGDYLQVDPNAAALAAVGIGAILCVLILSLLFLVARAFVRPGVIRLHSHILQTAEPMAVGVIFSGSDRFVHMLLLELLNGLVLFAVVLVAMIPAGAAIGISLAIEQPALMFVALGLVVLLLLPAVIYVGLGISLGAHAVTLEKRGPVDALKRSWHLASGNRWTLLAFFFCNGLVGLLAAVAGVLMCCVGLIVTVPGARAITDFATTESFLLLTRGHAVSDYWKLWQEQAAVGG